MNNELLQKAKDHILTSIPTVPPENVKGFAEAYSLLCAAEWQSKYSELELTQPLQMEMQKSDEP